MNKQADIHAIQDTDSPLKNSNMGEAEEGLSL